MKKFLFTIALLTLLLIVAVPGAVGVLTQYGHNQVATSLSGQGHQLEALSYQRGWFSSHANHRYQFDNVALAQFLTIVTGEPVNRAEFLIDSQLNHGLLPLVSSGSFTPAWTEIISTVAVTVPSGRLFRAPGKLESRIEPNGSSRYHYAAAPGSFLLNAPLVAQWQEVEINAEVNRPADQLKFVARVEGLELDDGDAAIALGPTRVDGDYQLHTAGWSGESNWSIYSILLPGAQVDKLRLQTRSANDSGQPLLFFSADAERIDAGTVNGSDAHIFADLKRADVNAVSELLRLTANRTLSFSNPTHRALMDQLLSGGPELRLYQLRLPTDAGAIEGEADIVIFPGTRLATINRRIKAQADFAIPQHLVEQFARNAPDQTRTAIEFAIALGMLKLEDARFVINAQLDRGILTVNGLPVPLPF